MPAKIPDLSPLLQEKKQEGWEIDVGFAPLSPLDPGEVPSAAQLQEVPYLFVKRPSDGAEWTGVAPTFAALWRRVEWFLKGEDDTRPRLGQRRELKPESVQEAAALAALGSPLAAPAVQKKPVAFESAEWLS